MAMLVLIAGAQQASAGTCVAGSITLKAPLYIVSVENKLISYQQLIGSVTKKAALRKDCVGYTTYTITGTQNLPYPDGTEFLVMGKNDFTSPVPAAIFLKVANGSIDSTFTAAGAQTGINSDPLNIYMGSQLTMRVKQAWK